MGLSFKKELTLADEQVYPPTQYSKKETTKTRLQERLIDKLGMNWVYAKGFCCLWPPWPWVVK